MDRRSLDLIITLDVVVYPVDDPEDGPLRVLFGEFGKSQLLFYSPWAEIFLALEGLFAIRFDASIPC